MDNDERIDFRLPSPEKDLFTRAAEADGLTLSTWIRRVAKAAARKLLGDEKLRGRAR